MSSTSSSSSAGSSSSSEKKAKEKTKAQKTEEKAVGACLYEVDDEDTFKKVLLNNSLVIVKWTADWCHWCHILSEKLPPFLKAYPEIAWIECDVEKLEDQWSKATELGAKGIPYCEFFCSTEESGTRKVKRISGLSPSVSQLDKFQAWIQKCKEAAAKLQK